MSTKEQTLTFEASAYLQRLLGRELIPSEEMAVLELVKNAYDSGASLATIVIQPEREKEPGYIELRDNGEGMTLEDLGQVFMFAGYSERPKQVRTGRRIPTGEKGIGRFAADKLGKRLTVLTKSKGETHGIRLTINWEAFSNRKKKFHDIKAPYELGPIPGLGKGHSGTTLVITDMRVTWDRPKIESLRTTVSGLIDPFRRPSDFEIHLEVLGSKKHSGPITQEQPKDADIEIEFRILGDGTVKRRLSGTLYKTPVEDHIHSKSDELKPLTGLAGRLFYYLKRPSKGLVSNLDPGVRIYRDGFRIEPFGSPTADWLGISERRAKRAGHAHVVPSRLFGFVEISRERHPDLIDTTSRQALLDGDAARGLVTFLKEQIGILEDKIRVAFAEPKWRENVAKQAVEREQIRLQALNIMSFGLAHEIRQPMQAIKSEAHNITTRLTQLGVKDQEIQEAQQNIDSNIDRIEKNIQLIGNISQGNFDDVTTFDLAEMVRDECELLETRLAALNIALELRVPQHQNATTNSTTVTQVLFNLLRNSMDALQECNDGRRRTITVSLVRTGKYHNLEVADNGPGVPEEQRPRIFKKFASKKTGGMGLGLFYCSILVQARRGKIDFKTRTGVGTTFSVLLRDEGGG